jgi:hypothetical protein
VAGVEEPVRTSAAAALLLLAAWPARPALAQERPSEADLFGAPPAAPPAAGPPATEQPPAAAAPGAAPSGDARGDSRGDALLGEGSGPRATGLISGEREDWLKLGGLAYLRALTSWTQTVAPSDWVFDAPMLLDVYLDARPNDRVRAFALGRLHYDPAGTGTRTLALGLPATPTTSGATSRAVLDQLWIKFDAAGTVFFTAGKQHVKWGTGRFWNPTDYLHPIRRDPLSQYDERAGVTMVKAHLPWEKRGWNFYGIALLDDLSGGLQPDGSVTTVSTLGQVGYGGRAEVVLGNVELAVDGMAQQGHQPRFGVDGSFPLWELDLHFEVALRRGRDLPRWEEVPGTTAADPIMSRYRLKQFDGLTPAAVAGLEWTWKYSDQDTLTLGGEYSYDASGYAAADIYPFLLATTYLPLYRPLVANLVLPDQRPAFTPFYLARQYVGLYGYLPAPGSWNNTSFTLSALGSLTDGSGVIRLDHFVVINTYLRVETFVAAHVGQAGGEFRFGATVPPQYLGDGPPPDSTPVYTPTITVDPPVLDVGVALRLAL